MALSEPTHVLSRDKDSPDAIRVWQSYSGLFVVDLCGWHDRYDRFTCCRSIALQYINERARLKAEYEARHPVKTVAEKIEHAVKKKRNMSWIMMQPLIVLAVVLFLGLIVWILFG